MSEISDILMSLGVEYAVNEAASRVKAYGEDAEVWADGYVLISAFSRQPVLSTGRSELDDEQVLAHIVMQ